MISPSDVAALGSSVGIVGAGSSVVVVLDHDTSLTVLMGTASENGASIEKRPRDVEPAF
jgi:hypothetical protein